MPTPAKTGSPPKRPTVQEKFCPKKPVRKVIGKNTVAIIVSCFMTTLSRLETVDKCVSRAPERRSR
jgi:hypothetical protein